MSRKRRLKAIEEQLTPAQLSWLWLKHVQRFDRATDYVNWFVNEAASSSARRAFLIQAANVMRRRSRDNSARRRSGGIEGSRAILREISSEWFKFWAANEVCGHLLEMKLMMGRKLVALWCRLDLWSAAAGANLDQANKWLKQDRVRAVVLGSLLRQENRTKEKLLVGDDATDAGVEEPQDEFWPLRPAWLDARTAKVIAAEEFWANPLKLYSTGFCKLTSALQKSRKPTLFAGLAARLKALEESYSTLVSWYNDAAAIGLLPPSFAVDPVPAKTGGLNAAQREKLKRLAEQFEAALKATVPSSESEAGRQSVPLNLIATKLLKKHLEKRPAPEKVPEDFRFPHVAEALKTRAHGLQSDFAGITTIVEDHDAYQRAAASFLVLEDLITDRISMPSEDRSRFLELHEMQNVAAVEQLIIFYRDLVPGGETATEQDLLELGVDGIDTAIDKRLSAMGAKGKEVRTKQSAPARPAKK